MKDTDALAIIMSPPLDIYRHIQKVTPAGIRSVTVSLTLPDFEYKRYEARAPATARIIRALDQFDPDELPAVLREIQNKFVVT